MHDSHAARPPSGALAAPIQAIVDFLEGSAGHVAVVGRRARAATALTELIDVEPLIEFPAHRAVPDLDVAWAEVRATVAEAIGHADAGVTVGALGRAADALRESRIKP